MSKRRVKTERRRLARRRGGEWAAGGQLNESQKRLKINVSCRPTKGSGDDSEEEGGAPHPKKQRKLKERKRIEKVSFFSR